MTHQPPAPTHPRARLRKAIGLLVLAWAAWLLGANVALNLGALETATSRHPERLVLRHGPALSLVPGQAWLWNAELAGHNRHLQWQLHAGRVHGRIALPALLRRELKLTGVRVAGGVDAELDRVAQELPPRRAPAPDGWRLVLDQLHVSGPQTLRWGGFRFHGEGEARIDVHKQLRGGPLSLSVRDTTFRGDVLDRDGGVLVANLSLSGDARLPTHRREDAPGLARLGLLELQVRGEGRLPAQQLQYDEDGRWQRLPSAAAPGEDGHLALALGLRDGALSQDSALSLELPLRGVDTSGVDWSQRLTARLSVDTGIALQLELPPPPDDLGHARIDLQLPGRTLPLACDGAGQARRCRIDAEPRRLLDRVQGSLDLRWQFSSLRWLGPALLRTPWLRLQGHGLVEAKIRIDDGAMAAGSWLRVPAVDLELDLIDAHLSGAAHALLEVGDGLGADATRLGFVLDRFELRDGPSGGPPHVVGSDLRLDARGPARLLELSRHSSLRLHFKNAAIPDLRTYQRHLPPQGIELLGGAGRLSADLHLDAGGGIGQGQLTLDTQATHVRFGELEFIGRLHLDAMLRGIELEQRRFDLAGTRLRLDEVEVLDHQRQRTTQWWLDARLRDATLEWGTPFDMHGHLEADARDIGLLLGLFGPLREYPAWIPRLLDAGNVDLETAFALDASGVRLQGLHARNRRLDVHADLQLGDPPAQGRLLVGFGPLHAGVALSGGTRQWHLRGARDWYQSGAAGASGAR